MDSVLFALDASRAFGEAVSARLAIPLSAHEEREFEDGEHKARPLVSVRGRDVFVIHSLYGEPAQSANDKLVRLLFFIGALKDAAAGAGHRRRALSRLRAQGSQDASRATRSRRATSPACSRRSAPTAWSRSTCTISRRSRMRSAAAPRTSRRIRCSSPISRRCCATREVAVVSPDAGGIKRAEQFRNRLAAALRRPVGAAFAEKYRSAGVVSGEALVGDVDGKVAIIIDDLISAGTTIARAAQACREHGATRVLAAASHGLFAGAANAVLAASAVEQIVVTDSVPPLRVTDAGLRAKLVQVSTASLFAEAIRRIHGGGSIVELLGA